MKSFFAAIVLLIVVQFVFAQTPPVAANDSFTINKNNSVSFYVLANDYDLDGDLLLVSIYIAPVNGSAIVNGSNVYYTPVQNYSGFDSLTYVVCDTSTLCDTASVYVIITANNNSPVANDDTYTVPKNSTTTLPALSNDYDADGDPLTVSVITTPGNGSVTISGTQFIYSPASNYTGSDSFVYAICDSAPLCDTAIVFIVVSGSNTTPEAIDDLYFFGDTLSEVIMNVISNDQDADGDSISVAFVSDLDSANDLGSVEVDAEGSVTFIRTELACGTETFQYVLCDYETCDTALVTVTITCPDDIFHTQGFSPDGDGFNDKLVFTGIEYFSPASIRVYNRYGSQVYESDEYNNDWDGTFKNSPLPDGTYFYVLKLANGKSYNNYLVIHR